MLYESGLIAEAAEPQANFDFALTGQTMRHDHRRVLATALSRLRAKIKYRPVIFELMPPEFTLLQLQNSVEAISGRLLHKQNFRRQIQQQTSSSRRIQAYRAAKAVPRSFAASATTSCPTG
ncbi:cytoplasmic membrane protein [Neisseria gonorrhoeae]|uniref:Cytoplasmic membrane protein n=1 Tax=Neisseria gonorrhoeae TaxID=485 RepID=A0A378VSR5_NEIGO|nr:cytoplasmic membrane protein [Neisseria gonorrhoeae]